MRAANTEWTKPRPHHVIRKGSPGNGGSGGSVGKILARTEQAIIPIVQLQGQVSIDSMRPADSNVKRDANIKVCNPEARGRDMVMDGVEAYSDNLPVVSYQDPNK
ncbi:hypothetical protein LWI29_003592 [Acer saccharum]|uniref:Uncharacterized protein n=1 Tax=Acer saccharum TaxID=4024 RepID=A0AA39W5H1_ACESA|nr:hypothetical protein LWI29_003592 [Acer saccharum]